MSALVLLTGVTGYVGGRLLPVVSERGYRVRCLARHPERLAERVPGGAEIVQGDVLDAASLAAAMTGVDTAYYLVHSMGGGGDFEALDRRGAANFGAAARAAGVRRIVYLGGLGEDGPGPVGAPAQPARGGRACCARRACRSSSSGPRSSSGRAACRSR